MVIVFTLLCYRWVDNSLVCQTVCRSTSARYCCTWVCICSLGQSSSRAIRVATSKEAYFVLLLGEHTMRKRHDISEYFVLVCLIKDFVQRPRVNKLLKLSPT